MRWSHLHRLIQVRGLGLVAGAKGAVLVDGVAVVVDVERDSVEGTIHVAAHEGPHEVLLGLVVSAVVEIRVAG